MSIRFWSFYDVMFMMLVKNKGTKLKKKKESYVSNQVICKYFYEQNMLEISFSKKMPEIINNVLWNSTEPPTSFSLVVSSSSSQLFIFHFFCFMVMAMRMSDARRPRVAPNLISTQCLHLKFGPHRFTHLRVGPTLLFGHSFFICYGWLRGMMSMRSFVTPVFKELENFAKPLRRIIAGIAWKLLT